MDFFFRTFKLSDVVFIMLIKVKMPTIIGIFMPPLFVECGRALSVAHVRPSVRACVRASFHHLGRYFVSAILLQFFPNPFETLQVFLSRTEDVHDFWI